MQKARPLTDVGTYDGTWMFLFKASLASYASSSRLFISSTWIMASLPTPTWSSRMWCNAKRLATSGTGDGGVMAQSAAPALAVAL